MKQEDDDLDLIYDDDECVDFIYNWISEQDRKHILKDDIQLVLDGIYEFYESKGLIEDDTTEEANIDEDEMHEFIRQYAKQENSKISDATIQLILAGEYEYGLEKGIYEEDVE
ncbi:MAG: hypothetical protein IKN91_09515 [Paludibacteraceae bacterium]|nr:hypothetical protein [Paludibacteraceae bacterium]